VGIADIAGVGQEADRSVRRRQFPADFLEGVCVASGEDEVAAFAGEEAGEGESDAASCAGDEGDLVAERFAGSNHGVRVRLFGAESQGWGSTRALTTEDTGEHRGEQQVPPLRFAFRRKAKLRSG
jgi:hypothetical protein